MHIRKNTPIRKTTPIRKIINTCILRYGPINTNQMLAVEERETIFFEQRNKDWVMHYYGNNTHISRSYDHAPIDSKFMTIKINNNQILKELSEFILTEGMIINDVKRLADIIECELSAMQKIKKLFGTRIILSHEIEESIYLRDQTCLLKILDCMSYANKLSSDNVNRLLLLPVETHLRLASLFESVKTERDKGAKIVQTSLESGYIPAAIMAIKANNSNLTSLDLSEFFINDQEFIELADALKNNTVLTELNIRNTDNRSISIRLWRDHRENITRNIQNLLSRLEENSSSALINLQYNGYEPTIDNRRDVINLYTLPLIHAKQRCDVKAVFQLLKSINDNFGEIIPDGAIEQSFFDTEITRLYQNGIQYLIERLNTIQDKTSVILGALRNNFFCSPNLNEQLAIHLFAIDIESHGIKSAVSRIIMYLLHKQLSDEQTTLVKHCVRRLNNESDILGCLSTDKLIISYEQLLEAYRTEVLKNLDCNYDTMEKLHDTFYLNNEEFHPLTATYLLAIPRVRAKLGISDLKNAVILESMIKNTPIPDPVVQLIDYDPTSMSDEKLLQLERYFSDKMSQYPNKISMSALVSQDSSEVIEELFSQEVIEVEVTEKAYCVYNNLSTYINKIGKYIGEDGGINFSQGFWAIAGQTFNKSRALNREANYLLAKELQNRILNGEEVVKLFQPESVSKLRTEIRNSLISKLQKNEQKQYTDYGIQSKDLNTIIQKFHAIKDELDISFKNIDTEQNGHKNKP